MEGDELRQLLGPLAAAAPPAETEPSKPAEVTPPSS
jgi:hypothetical protein